MSRLDPISRLWESVVAPGADELRQLARRASAAPQQVDRPATARRRRPRARWAVAIAAVALLIGSGLGFGLANRVTPSSTASRNVVGFGFLPDPGWTVVQTAGPGPGATTATATRNGIVLSVTSTPRGDPAKDAAYPAQDLPLQVARARRLSAEASRFVLRAGVGGYNIDARIDFGSSPLTAARRTAAQRQLNRLVVAADRVTIAVRPPISSPATTLVTVFGTIDSGRAGESVTVQAKECDNTFFRAYAGASTEAGGSWSTVIYPLITTTLRAVWNNETSAEVTFHKRVWVNFEQRSAIRFSVRVGSGTRFIGKRVTIQRFDQRLGRWEAIRKIALMSERHASYFTLRVPKSTRLRAVFPNSQARPCFLGGTSPTIRT